MLCRRHLPFIMLLKSLLKILRVTRVELSITHLKDINIVHVLLEQFHRVNPLRKDFRKKLMG